MTAREYLEQLKVLDTKINQKIEELATLKSSVSSTGGIDYSVERVQSSGTGDKVGNGVSRYIDLNEEINREIDSFYDAKHVIINQIQGLNVDDYIKVLFKRYVQFKDFYKVADEIEKSYTYTLELHKKALNLFDEMHNNLDYIT